MRAALPDAAIAVDHFHLIMLADKQWTAVRQRVTRELLGGAAGRSTWRGPTAGCCCADASGSRRRRWRGCGTAASIMRVTVSLALLFAQG
ncbi:MAG: transposase, partial [Actinomycetes bacterium]